MHPDVNKHLFVSCLIIVRAVLIHTDDIAVSDESVLEVSHPACWTEGRIEEERHRRTVILLHRLIEELAGIQIGNDNREVEVVGKYTSKGVPLVVTTTETVVVIILYCKAL